MIKQKSIFWLMVVSVLIITYLAAERKNIGLYGYRFMQHPWKSVHQKSSNSLNQSEHYYTEGVVLSNEGVSLKESEDDGISPSVASVGDTSAPSTATTQSADFKYVTGPAGFSKLGVVKEMPIKDDKTPNLTITQLRHAVVPELLQRLRPEIMKQLPLKFLPEYKNPCYVDDQNSTHCLPYLLLLGMPKCGTTDLYTKLHQHPDIGSIRKEPHWLTRRSRNGQSLLTYADKFFSPAIRSLTEELGRRRDRAITVDASASTFWDNYDWIQTYPEYINEGPPYIMADVIKALLPDAKLIVIFREPASRLYSDYVFFKAGKQAISPKDFHQEVLSSITSYKECLTSRGSDYACAYDKYSSRINVGLFPLYTREWLKRYPRDQFMFLNLDDWHSNCPKTLHQIFEFIEVEELTDDMLNTICNRSIAFNNSKKKAKVGPMWNETRTMLRDFYRKYVIDLADVLQDNGFLWDYKR